MKYVKLFDTEQEYQTYKSSADFIDPNVSTCIDSGNTYYTQRDYSKEYLTLEIEEPSTEQGLLYINGSSYFTIYYSINGGDWEIATRYAIRVKTGDKVRAKCSITTETPSSDHHINFSCSVITKFKVYGNIMSLYYGDNFRDQFDLHNTPYAFISMFENSQVTDASNLILPATILGNSCYAYMFSKCAYLAIPPKLPATTLAVSCYAYMFRECSSLTKAPMLPATTLAPYCYSNMFRACTALIEPPILNATTLADHCYFWMFFGCTALSSLPNLPATTLASYCYSGMFYRCTSLTTTASIMSAAVLADYCCYQMFSECTSLINTYSLNGTKLVDHCYEEMFYSCTSLNSIAMLATDYGGSYFFRNWVKGVLTTDGTFTKNSVIGTGVLPIGGDSGIPSGWTVVNI